MFKQMSYRKKNRLLLAFFIVLAWISYSFAIKETIDVYSVVYAEKTSDLNAINSKIARIEQELMEMDLSARKSKDAGGTRQELFALINRLCVDHSLTISDIPQTTVEDQHGYILETNMFSLKGNFRNMLFLVHHLEQKEKLANISSVKYALTSDHRSQQKSLVATITLQNLTKSKE